MPQYHSPQFTKVSSFLPHICSPDLCFDQLKSFALASRVLWVSDTDLLPRVTIPASKQRHGDLIQKCLLSKFCLYLCIMISIFSPWRSVLACSNFLGVYWDPTPSYSMLLSLLPWLYGGTKITNNFNTPPGQVQNWRDGKIAGIFFQKIFSSYIISVTMCSYWHT